MAPQSSRAAVPTITLSKLASIYTQSALAVQFAAKVIALNLFVDPLPESNRKSRRARLFEFSRSLFDLPNQW